MVDDDPDTCSVMSRILQESGAIVTTATDVDGGLIELEQFHPQVLVSDLGMPERDGYELIREVRRAAIRTGSSGDRFDGVRRPPGSPQRPSGRLSASSGQAP